MAQTIAYLEAIVGADLTSFRRGMAEVRGELTATQGLAGGLTSLGTALTLGITVPLAAIGVAGLKVFTDLDAALRNVNSIVQLSEADFQALQDRIVDFGAGIREGSLGAANALYTVVSSGFGLNDINEAFQVMDVAVQTAEAGLSDLDVTTQALVSSLLAYSQGADSAASFSDILTRTVAIGVGTMEQFAGSIGLVLPTASLLGVTFQELGEATAFLTQRGLSPSEAYTSLNGVFRTLIKPGEDLTAMFQQLGVSTGTELLEKFGGLEGALKAIMEASGGSAEALSKLFPEIRAYRGVASIIGNFGDYAKLVDEFGEAVEGATSRAHAEQAKSLAFQLDVMVSSFKSFLSEIGERLAPMVGELTDTFGNFFNELRKMPKEQLDQLIRLGLLAAIIPPIILLLGLLLSPIGLITTGIVLLAKAINDNFLGIGDTLNRIITPIKNFAEGMVAAFNGDPLTAFQNFVEAGLSNDLAVKFTNFFQVLGIAVKSFVGGFEVWMNLIGMYAEYYINNVIIWFQKLPEEIGKVLANIGTDKLTAIAIGLGAIGAAIVFYGLPILISSLGTAFGVMAANVTATAIALGGMVVAALPIIGIALLISGLLIAWQNNTLGLKTRTDELRQTFINTIETIKQLLVIFTYYWAKISGQDPVEQVNKSLAQLGMPLLQTSPNPNHDAGAPDWMPDWVTKPMADGSVGAASGYPPTDPYDRSRNRNRQLVIPQSDPVPLPDDHWRGNSDPYGIHTRSNSIIIQTNDPDYIMRELRRKGIDLDASRRG